MEGFDRDQLVDDILTALHADHEKIMDNQFAINNRINEIANELARGPEEEMARWRARFMQERQKASLLNRWVQQTIGEMEKLIITHSDKANDLTRKLDDMLTNLSTEVYQISEGICVEDKENRTIAQVKLKYNYGGNK